MKKYGNMYMSPVNNRVSGKVTDRGVERREREVIVRIGKITYKFDKGDPEWQDWMHIPSFQDTDMVYALMTGAYVEEYKALIPNEIVSFIKEEVAPDTQWSKKLEEAYHIYNRIGDVLDTNTACGKEIREDGLFEKVYDILYDVVSIFYKISLYSGTEEEYSEEIHMCSQRYKNVMDMLRNYKKELMCKKESISSSLFHEMLQSVDKLKDILKLLIRNFYELAIKYGTDFRNYDKKYQNS